MWGFGVAAVTGVLLAFTGQVETPCFLPCVNTHRRDPPSCGGAPGTPTQNPTPSTDFRPDGGLRGPGKGVGRSQG